MLTIYTERHHLHATDHAFLDGKLWDALELPVRGEILHNVIQKGNFGPILGPQDGGLAPILHTHDADYIHFLRAIAGLCGAGPGSIAPILPEIFIPDSPLYVSSAPMAQIGRYSLDRYAPILAGTFEAAYWAAQCAVTAADAVADGEPMAYALTRPPGHHAANRCAGFCFINSVAVAAKRIQSRMPGRIAVFDVDVHHGNGTQTLFYSDPTVFFASIHGHPDWLYPYFMGHESEIGIGDGVNYTRNWPLARGTDGPTYLKTVEMALTQIMDYSPAVLLVSLGFDTAADDPYGGFRLTASDFHDLGRRILNTNLPLLLVQEGGYGLEGNGMSALGTNAHAFFRGLNAL